MSLRVLYENKQFENPIKYAFDVLLTTLGVDYQIDHYGEARFEISEKDIYILYGEEDILPQINFKVHIHPSTFFGQDYLRPESMPRLPLHRVNIEGRDIPILYYGNHKLVGSLGVSVKEWDGQKVISTHLDLIASSFFLLSRYEEVISTKRDEHGRFPAGESLLYKEGLLCHPIVNDYMELLWNWIDSFSLNIKRRPLWPDGKQFAVCLTHDVDQVKKWRLLTILRQAKYCAALSLQRRTFSSSIKRGLKVIESLIKGENPYWNFVQIVEKEKEYGFSSSFYFLAGKHCIRDGDYNINNDENVKTLIRELVSRGVEVGLHGSYTSYNNGQRLSQELEALARLVGDVHGTRQHYLRLDLLKTFAIQEEIGVEYDTTLGFAQNEGWRSSFSFPYHPWNFQQNSPFRILEIPLTIMDGTLGEAQYEGLTAEEGWKATENILSGAEKSKGCATLLWHNSYFDELTAPGFGKVYWEALNWICEHNGWGTSGYEIYKWWCKKR